MAFVHLHNHSDFSVLDGATRIKDMVKRAVDLGMPAVALTDHGYMFGVPNLDQECRSYNDKAEDKKQWLHDLNSLKNGVEPTAPLTDGADGTQDKAYLQWQKDMSAWQLSQNIQDVEAAKPNPLIKPIFGCEAYFITDEQIERGSTQHRYHLILLAKNERGYVNLMKMMSLAANEMYYYKPRTTLEMLKKYHEGIICQSACVQGILAQNILDANFDEALHWAQIFKDIFADDFYIEIQDHGLTFRGGWTDRAIAERLVEIAHKLDIKVVATNDFHYLLREDAPTQDILSCIGTGSHIDDPNRKQMESNEFYMKDEAEMRELFSWCPEALDNTVEVADKCNYSLDWSHIYLPKFPGLKDGETSEERFRKECEKGLAKRYGDNWRELEVNGVNVKERFEYEYKVICYKGFADYFLIVQEYVQWAKDNGIGVGPGRGSAAGAIVAYAMNITSFDPLENGLMFERFLSLERTEMPDIDMDFDDERRLEVVQHVRELYGSDRVCHVITYSTIKAKQAINDAARVLGFPVWQGQRLSKMLSNDPSLQLDNALHKKVSKDKEKDLSGQYSPDFVEAYEKDPDAHRIIDAALSIEGLTRGEGVHACAVLITPTPVNDHVPTKLDTKGGVEITQYEGHSVADMGLLKMDFLGLRTLTVISRTLQNIRLSYPHLAEIDSLPEPVRVCLKTHATSLDLDVDAIPFDDPKIFELLGSGHTAGVFQVESAGMTATIKNMQPKEYRQVVALIALYRPGPLGAGMVKNYIDRMHGKKEIVYYDNRLEPILSETYGTIVYQEQVMQISVAMSGFTKGESDSRIRKPVAKKKIKLLTTTVFSWENGKEETTYDHWMNGAQENGYSREIAQKIWDDVLEFASYAFNKSHSAGYAILVMQTAWLKAYFPREFMASVLTSYMGKTDKIVHYVNACRHEGIAILPPDINESGRDFTATQDGIRFGFAGIRGVGEGAAEQIMAERKAGGPFETLFDFVDRLDSSVTNKRVIEALVKSGAFDSTGYPRRQLMWLIDKTNPENILDAAAKRQRDRASGQSSFFDMFAGEGGSAFQDEIPAPDSHEWDRFTKLHAEHEVLGLYVSDHPLSPFEYALSKARDYTIGALFEREEVSDQESGSIEERFIVADGSSVHLAGMVTTVQKKTTKNGDPMAVVGLEDMEGEISLVIFPKLYKKVADLLSGTSTEQEISSTGDIFIKVLGNLERGDRGDQIICSTVEALDLSEESNRPKIIELNLRSDMLSLSPLMQLQEIFSRYPGLDRVEVLIEESSGNTLRMELPVKVDAENIILIAEIKELLGQRGLVSLI